VRENRKIALRCALSGACAGLINGFFGGGGGMALVPLLREWCGLEEKKAFATCVAVIAPVCAVSAALYIRRCGVDWALLWPYLAGGLLGGAVSGRTFGKVPPKALRKLFALFLLYGGVRAWL